jgi:hypothetical protein
MNLALQLVAFVGVPGALLALTLILRSRERIHLLDVVRSTAEHGHPLTADVVMSLRRGRPPATPDRDYRRGVLLVAVASAIALIGFCAYVFAVSMASDSALGVGTAIAAFGAIPGCIGTALIVLSRTGRDARVD